MEVSWGWRGPLEPERNKHTEARYRKKENRLGARLRGLGQVE